MSTERFDDAWHGFDTVKLGVGARDRFGELMVLAVFAFFMLLNIVVVCYCRCWL